MVDKPCASPGGQIFGSAMIRKLSVLVMTLGLGLALGLAPSASSAADEPQPNPVKKVIEKIQDIVKPSNVHAAAVEAPEPPASDDDSPGNETVNPSSPDHAANDGVEAGIGTLNLLGANRDNATVNDDDTTSADSTALSLLGLELIGAHATSGGTTEDHFGDPLSPLCEASGGAACLGLIFSDAQASNDGTTAQATSKSGVADVCALGSDPGGESCAGGLLSLGAATGTSTISRDVATGQTVADSNFSTVGVCLTPSLLGCGLAVDVLGSFGHADSGGLSSSADRGSFLLSLGTENNPNGFVIEDPLDLSIPPGCDGGLLQIECLFLNQGETFLGPLVGGTAQDALKLGLLPGLLGSQLANVAAPRLWCTTTVEWLMTPMSTSTLTLTLMPMSMRTPTKMPTRMKTPMRTLMRTRTRIPMRTRTRTRTTIPMKTRTRIPMRTLTPTTRHCRARVDRPRLCWPSVCSVSDSAAAPSPSAVAPASWAPTRLMPAV